MGGSIKGTLSCDTPTGNTATTMKPTKLQMGDRIGACRGLTGQSEENRHLEDQGVDGKRTLKKSSKSGMGHGMMSPTIGTCGGFCESGNERRVT